MDQAQRPTHGEKSHLLLFSEGIHKEAVVSSTMSTRQLNTWGGIHAHTSLVSPCAAHYRWCVGFRARCCVQEICLATVVGCQSSGCAAMQKAPCCLSSSPPGSLSVHGIFQHPAAFINRAAVAACPHRGLRPGSGCPAALHVPDFGPPVSNKRRKRYGVEVAALAQWSFPTTLLSLLSNLFLDLPVLWKSKQTNKPTL